MNKELYNAEYISSIIDSMSDMVRVIDRDGTVVLTNKAFDKRMGKTVGQRCYCAFSQDAECERCLSREAMEDGRNKYLTRKHNGRVYSVTVSALKNNAGQAVASVEVFRDISLEYNIKQNLLIQNAKMQKDLNLARKLQKALVKSRMPGINGVSVTAGFFPCEAVGGDIYDCALYGDKLVMYVADVCGHGVMPAMLAVFFSRVVRAACSMGKFLPSEILSYCQQEYLDLQLADTMYITAFIAVVDTKTKLVTYSNAGLSVSPIVFLEGEKIRELYMPSNPLSNWFLETQFHDGSFELTDGMRFLIYSDGIDDIHCNESVKERLFELFSTENFEAKKFIAQVKSQLHASHEDDLTMLLCEKERTV
ncbi:MAG: SpoIIE family protein phosphatase [Christensenellaceae bacterium]